MTTTPKPPTPQGISALLRKAGFKRSESSTTQIKGWRNYSEGFKVARSHGIEPGVRVEHKTGFRRGPETEKRRTAMLTQYAEAIAKAGYCVERDELWPGLNVTAESAERTSTDCGGGVCTTAGGQCDACRNAGSEG